MDIVFVRLTYLLRTRDVRVDISARKPAVLIEAFLGFSQFLKANYGIVH
jgi:hypothetical protein